MIWASVPDAAMTPFRGEKATTWEGGQRVPFIVSWPGQIQPSVSDALLSSLELYPTLARIGGATLPTDRVIDGLDATDLLLGKTEQSPRETFFYYMCNNLEAVRQALGIPAWVIVGGGWGSLLALAEQTGQRLDQLVYGVVGAGQVGSRLVRVLQGLGWQAALKANPHLANGLNVHAGKVTYEEAIQKAKEPRELAQMVGRKI